MKYSGFKFFFWLILFGLFPATGSAAAGDIVTATPTSWATVALAGISALGGVITFLKARQVHVGLEETKALVLKIELSVNSRMDKLLEVTKQLGERKGAEDEKARQNTVTVEVERRMAQPGDTGDPEVLARDTNVTVHRIEDAPALPPSKPSAAVPPKPKKDS